MIYRGLTEEAVQTLRDQPYGQLSSRAALVRKLMARTRASRATCFRAVRRAFKAGSIQDGIAAWDGGSGKVIAWTDGVRWYPGQLRGVLYASRLGGRKRLGKRSSRSWMRLVG